MGQHELVVQARIPVHELLAIRARPEARDEGAQQQHLHEAHARVRRHLEGAEFQQPQASRRASRRVELVDRELRAVRVAGEVDEEVAQDPVDEPRLLVRLVRLEARLELLEGDAELVERVVARLVHARALARRADEHPREEIRERRMVLPVGDEAAQEIGPAQQRALRRRRPAERHVVAAARAGVAPVEHELLGAEPREARLLVERLDMLLELVPVGGGMDVHLDHAGVGRDGEAAEARIVRRRVALEANAQPQRLHGRFDRRDERDEILEQRHRRKEHVQLALAHFHA